MKFSPKIFVLYCWILLNICPLAAIGFAYAKLQHFAEQERAISPEAVRRIADKTSKEHLTVLYTDTDDAVRACMRIISVLLTYWLYTTIVNIVLILYYRQLFTQKPASPK